MLRQTISRSLKVRWKLPYIPKPSPPARSFTSKIATVLPGCTCYPSAPTTRQRPTRHTPLSIRFFTTSHARRSQPIPQVSTLTDREYHEISDETMDLLTDRLETLQEELGNTDCDVEYSSGVLTLQLPDSKGTYVINKQPPNKQIWLSSPLSGPKRYDYSQDEKAWFYTRDGSKMIELLEKELSDKLGMDVLFD